MKVFYYRRSLGAYLNTLKSGLSFVPTMGALHQGHIALVKAAKAAEAPCLVSIFVNPRQFNNPADLEKYPRTMATDLAMLQQAGADAVYLPVAEDIFDKKESIVLDISPLDKVFEGEFRPGHFQGVADVLHAFFSLVHPSDVYFGLKDLQQCMVVAKLIQRYFPEIRQHNQPTIREFSGLAMSSRNKRLSTIGLEKAANIYKELQRLSNSELPMQDEIEKSIENLGQVGIETEYLELISLPDMAASKALDKESPQALVYAGYLEGVRLIDNLTL